MSGDHDLEAAEYVLGTLDASAREAFNARLLRDKEARAAVAAWETRLSGLSEGIAPMTPPAHVWTKLERALWGQGAAARRFRVIEGGAVPANPVAGVRRALRRWKAIAATSTAIAAALAVFTVYRLVAPRGEGDQGATYVAAVNRNGDRPALLVRVELKTHNVFVRPISADTPTGKSLELWYISDGNPPRSMGIVGSGPLSLPLPAGTHADEATFAVSVEPPGGSPSGVATGPVIYSGQLIKE